MKISRSSLALGLALALPLAPAAPGPLGAQPSQSPRIGFIDSRTIIEEAPGAKEAQEEFDQEMSRYRAQVQEMGQSLQQMIERFEQQQLTLSPDAKRQRREEIQEKQQEYQQKVQQLENQAARRQQELVEPIMQRINRVIEDIRREGDYTMIFDVASGAVIAADPANDLTSEVIRRLKQMASNAPGGDGER